MHVPHVEMLHHSCGREQKKASECDTRAGAVLVLFYIFWQFTWPIQFFKLPIEVCFSSRRKQIHFPTLCWPSIKPASKPSRAWPGGKREESLQLRLWNLNICIEKVQAKCWLVEMTLVMTSLPLARVFQCLFTFALVSTSRWLVEISSESSVDGELQGNWRWNSNSRDVVASSPFFSRPAARAPRRACP